MLMFFIFSCPNNIFCCKIKIVARQSWFGVCFLPTDNVENLITKFLHTGSYREYIMVGSCNENGTSILQSFSTCHQPLSVKIINFFERSNSIPLTFFECFPDSVDASGNIFRQKIRRVSKDNIHLLTYFINEVH